MSVIKLKSVAGKPVEFVDTIIGAGGMKDVYFSPDKSYVVCFYRTKQDYSARERLQNIVGPYRDKIFLQVGGNYWENLYCWPSDMVEYGDKLGIVVPTYRRHFFFQYGSVNNDVLGIKGKEKEGKWFASAQHRNRSLDPREKGDWLSHLRVCILISRAVRRLHMAGLAHSDLSYKNVLVDPSGGNACIIDIDGLVVPGKFPPDVVGTPDFIAPEVMMTRTLKLGDPGKALPKIQTDQHALSVLIYMYLLYRHPLRGGKVHDQDPQKDEELSMGAKALFIEHPKDRSNAPRLDQLRKSWLPWWDTGKLPYSLTGPYIKQMFDRAFIEGLQDPSRRPTADDWEQTLVKTVDLIQPCTNPSCEQKWFPFDNSISPKCPFCGSKFQGMLPVLNLYSSRGGDKYRPDNHRLMVYHNQYLYPWHVNRNVFPNEKMRDQDKKPVGYFVFHEGYWVLVNQRLPNLRDLTEQKDIPPNTMVVLKEGKQLLLSPEPGGRLVVVQMASA